MEAACKVGLHQRNRDACKSLPSSLKSFGPSLESSPKSFGLSLKSSPKSLGSTFKSVASP